MRDIVNLRTFWQRNADRELALCTLIRKVDSGYRAVGAKKIVARAGGACGLLSGGCLEGDIERTARDNWARLPFVESFNTMNDTDRLLGYQAGCAGLIEILFEALPAAANLDLYLPFGTEAKATGVSVSLAGRHFGEKFTDEIFFDPWIKPIQLFIVGCGADAPPFAELAAPLGWPLRFLDYRGDFSLPETCSGHAEIFSVADLARQIPDDARTAVVVMTHNYEADMTVLAGLNGRALGYVGCLGPRQRYEQMKIDLRRLHDVEITPAWENIVHAPAGLFIGHAPEEIALSIIAQISASLPA